MIGLLQRVSTAQVEVAGEQVGAIGPGLLVLVAVQRGDDESRAERLLERLLSYRVFPDATGRMNLSLRDTGGGLLLVPQFTLAADTRLLLVPQFTLAADTRKGTRASFTPAAAPEEGRRLFVWLLSRAEAAHPRVAAGRFGADMRVSLVNEGPVTFWLES